MVIYGRYINRLKIMHLFKSKKCKVPFDSFAQTTHGIGSSKYDDDPSHCLKIPKIR